MTSSPSQPAASRGLLIANLLAQFAFGLLAMTICLPSMQEWGAMFDASQAAVQLTFSGYVIAYGGAQLLYGPFSDRLGRRQMLLLGAVIGGVGSVMAALATDLNVLIAARVIQGAGCAAGMVVGRALIQDLFQGPDRTRIMAYVGMTLGLCPPLATLLGGQLHVQLGWQANFVLMALLSLVLGITAWRGLPASPRPATNDAGSNWLQAMAQSYARLAREPAFLLYVTVMSTTTAVFYTFLGGAPIVLGSYGVGPEGIGLYIMFVPAFYIVGNYLTTHLVRRIGEQRVMWLGQACSLCGLAIMLALALGGVGTPLAVAMPLMFVGLGHGLLMPPTLAGTVGLIPALAGSAAAVAGLMQQMLGAAGGFLVGLVTHENAVNLSSMMLAVTVISTSALLWLSRVRPSAPAPVRSTP